MKPKGHIYLIEELKNNNYERIKQKLPLGVLSTRERASSRFVYQMLEYSNVRKKRREEATMI